MFFALAACGAPVAPAAEAKSAEAAAPAETAKEEPIEITAVLQLNPEIVLDSNPLIKMMEDELNIRLKVEAPPQSSYGDRVKMLVSTGDMPDLVHYGADILVCRNLPRFAIMALLRTAELPRATRGKTLQDTTFQENFNMTKILFVCHGRSPLLSAD